MTESRLGENRIAPLGHATAPRTAAPTRSSARRKPKPRLWRHILRTVGLALFATIFTVVSAILPFVLLGLAVNYTDRKFSVALVNLVLNLGPP